MPASLLKYYRKQGLPAGDVPPRGPKSSTEDVGTLNRPTETVMTSMSFNS
jgi:hypothetical protein